MFDLRSLRRKIQLGGDGSIEKDNKDNVVRIVVLGATGRLGQMLRWGWRGRDDLSVLYHRRPVTHPEPRSSVPYVQTPVDPANPQFQTLCQSADVVVNLLGVVPRVGADLSQNTPLGLAPVLAGAKAVLAASSAAVYSDVGGPCRETDICAPASAYGISKRDMEQALAAYGSDHHICALRIANVAGADQLLGQLEPDITPNLHMFEDGTTPKRSYITPQGFADVMGQLVKQPSQWPPILNVTAKTSVYMGDLLSQAGRIWTHSPAPAQLPPCVALDSVRLAQHVNIDSMAGNSEEIIAQWTQWAQRA